jgi:hypothetical protein
MPTWPATLPNQFVGLTDKRQDAVARTPMDAGPQSRRARFTAASREFHTPIFLTGAQRAIFDQFFIVDLIEGTLAFDWEDPVTDATISLSFRAPPEWSLFRGASDPERRVWQASLELEIQP